MKKNIIWLFILLLAAGCLNDENNYDYTEINSVEDFTVKNLENTSCFIGDVVTLKPTIKLSVDSINPDVSYEWYVEGVLKSTEPVFDFVAEKITDIKIVFVVIDNKTGVRYPSDVTIAVQSRWLKGWVILSRGTSGESQLSMVLMKIERFTRPGEDGTEVKADTIIYTGEERNIYPDLGYGPRKIVENFTCRDYDYPGIDPIDDELMIIQENKCIELHGNTLERQVFSEEEFLGEIPAGFSPQDAVLSWSSKCLLNKDNLLYFNINSVCTDLHAGRYLSDPALGGQKIAAIYPVNKGAGYYAQFFLALDEKTNSIFGILDDARAESGTPNISVANNVGAPIEILDKSSMNMHLLKNIKEKVLYTMWENSGSYGYPSYISILKDEENNRCLLHQFSLMYYAWAEPTYLDLQSSISREVDPAMVRDFTDATVFPHKKYLMVASGNTLWHCAYQDKNDNGKPIRTFDKKIVSINYKDINSNKYGGGHLGVALEGGEFYIFEVTYPEANNVNSVKLRELYHQTGFGEIVDVAYKFGTLFNLNGSGIN